MTKSNPFVSIILPIRNESGFILTILNSLFIQDYPGDLEVIFVDGMSTDNTRLLITEYITSHRGNNIQLVENPKNIVPTGLNIALRLAKGEIIIRCDGHTVISRDYVRNCVDLILSSKADNVGGKMNAVGTNPFGEAVAMATSSPFGIGSARFHFSNKEEFVDTVYMGAWPRTVFEKIGLFDEELVRDQDDEFNYRLREAGGKIFLSPKIKSEYTVRGTPSSLWRQYYQYGYWKVRVLQKHTKQMSSRQFVPPIFVLGLLLSVLLAFSPLFWLFSLVIPGMYIIANVSASVWTARKTGLVHLPLLPIVFAILHVSYGLGFLLGLIKFWNRWGDKIGRVPAWENSPID